MRRAGTGQTFPLGAVNSLAGLVTGHPGAATQSGPRGMAVRTVGWQPGEANPTQTPLCTDSLPGLPRSQKATARKALKKYFPQVTIEL